MEYLIHGVPCLNLTVNNDKNIINWINVENSTSEVIDVNALLLLRQLFRYNMKGLFKEWCGPNAWAGT